MGRIMNITTIRVRMDSRRYRLLADYAKKGTYVMVAKKRWEMIIFLDPTEFDFELCEIIIQKSVFIPFIQYAKTEHSFQESLKD